MKKIGILTFTSNYNMGTFMQAYSSLLSIRKLAPDADVEIVNYHSKKKYNKDGYDKLKLFNKRYIYLPFLFRHIRRIYGYRNCQIRFLGIEPKKGLISDSHKEINTFFNDKQYDIVFVGSDTVLRLDEWHYHGNNLPAYWIPFHIAGKKALLAASVDTTFKIERLSNKLKSEMHSCLEGFDFLGVRDPISYNVIKRLSANSNNQIELVPDPTFSYALNHRPIDIYLKKKKFDFKKPTLGLDVPIGLPGIEQYVEYLKNKGFQVATWRYWNAYTDYDLSGMTPIEWSGVFKYFDLTITNRFHAAIFSLKNFTPVIAIDHARKRYLDNYESKTFHLLKQFNSADLCHWNINELNDQINFAMIADRALCSYEKENLSQLLDQCKKQYTSYLKNVLFQ